MLLVFLDAHRGSLEGLECLSIDVDGLLPGHLDDLGEVAERTVEFLEDDVALRSELKEFTIRVHFVGVRIRLNGVVIGPDIEQ